MDVVVVVVIVLFTILDTVWTQCSGPSLYTDHHDVIISYPVYSSLVPGRRHCEWRFQKTSRLIRVEILSFHLNANSSCDSGQAPYVEIFSVNRSNNDWSTRNTSSAGRWCGDVVAATVQVETDVSVVFRADSSEEVGTFQIKVSHQEHFRYCKSDAKQLPLTVSPGSTAYIYSPGFPVIYPNVTHCEWEVQANSSDFILVVEILNSRLEHHDTCKYDNFTISGVGRDLAVRCGEKHSMLLQSTGDRLHVNFTSDGSVEKRGFVLKIYARKPYNTSCLAFGSRALIADLTPSLLTLSHEKHVFSCSWLIQALTNDHVVYIETVEWDHDVLSCGSEKGLHIYDGRSDTDTRLVLSCGIERPFGFLRSTGQHLLIRADLTVTMHRAVMGFSIKYSSRLRRDFPDRYAVPSFGLSYMRIPAVTSSSHKEMIHAWTFSAVDGHKCVEVAVTFRWLKEKNDTFTRYFDAYDGKKAEGIPLGYCSTAVVKPKISGTGGDLTLIQKSNVQGWYIRIKSSDVCTGDLNILDITGSYQNLDFSVKPRSTGLQTCRWKLQTLSYKWITVHPQQIEEDFNYITFDNDCQQGSLTSYDLDSEEVKEAGDTRMIKRWCPGGLVYDRVVSSTNFMMLVYTTDVRYATSFSLKIESVPSASCKTKNILTATYAWQYLTSPGYPVYNYPNNMLCDYRLNTETRTHVIRLDVVTLELGDRGENCSTGDHITLLDETGSYTVNIIGLLCGSGYTTTSYRSSGRTMRLSFTSNSSRTYSGFRVLFYQEETDQNTKCTHNVVATRNSQILMSPSYPLNYPSDQMCSWLISAYNSHVIELHVLDFHLASTANTCTQASDVVHVYDGISTNSRVLATMCGSFYDYDRKYKSSGWNMYIIFKSDKFLSARGFKMEFHALQREEEMACGGQTEQLIATPWSSILTSPGYPDSYPDNSICRWRIKAMNRSDVVHVTVLDSFLEETGRDHCMFDVVKVYDGYRDSSRSLGEWCSSSTPDYTSSQMYMYIVFTSDHTGSKGGFRLAYSSQPLGNQHRSSFSTGASIGGIVGGIMGGVVGLLLLVIMCMCLIHRTRTSSQRARTHDPVIVNRHNSTVFVMSPVYVGDGGQDLSAPPPAYPGITNPGISNPAYLTTPDDLPPSYSSVTGYQVAGDSSEVTASCPAAEYLIPVSGSGLQSGLQFRPAPLVRRIPETSQNEYAEAIDPPDSRDRPYVLDLPQAPAPPSDVAGHSRDSPSTETSDVVSPPSYESSQTVSSEATPSDEITSAHPYSVGLTAPHGPGDELPRSTEPPSTGTSDSVPPPYESFQTVSSEATPGPVSPRSTEAPSTGTSDIVPPPYESFQTVSSESTPGPVSPRSREAPSTGTSDIVPPPYESFQSVPPPAEISSVYPYSVSLIEATAPPAYEFANSEESSALVPPPSYESAQSVAPFSALLPASDDISRTVDRANRPSVYENSEPVRPRRNLYDALGPV